MRQILAIVCMCFLGAACSSQYSGKQPPKVINGQIDLTSWDFEKDGPVMLNGDWLFAWEKFVEPASWKKLQQEMVHQLPLPGRWNTIDNPTKADENLAKKGYASYALKIKGLNERNFDLGIGLWVAGHVFILDNDGIILDREIEGKPATNPSEEVPIAWSDLTFTYTSKSFSKDKAATPASIVLLIHHSNFHLHAGGINYITLGQQLNLVQEAKSFQNQKVMLIGIFLIIGSIHFILFIQRPEDKSILFFSILCLFFALRMFVSGIAQDEGIGASASGHELLWKIDFTCFVALPLSCVLYLNYLLPTYWFSLLSRILILPAVCFQFYTLLLSSLTLLKNLNYYLSFILISLAASTIHIILRIIRKQPGSVWVLVSFIILLGGFLNDLLHSKEYINTGFVASFCMGGFIIMQTLIISRRSVEAYRQSELLAHKLNRELEEKKELQQSNEELAKKQKKYGKLIEELSEIYAKTGEQLDAAKAEQVQIAKELKEASNQLVQAEKLSGLGAMVSGIAHDINNPLNFIETARFQEQEKLDQLKEHLLGLVPEGKEGEEFKEDLLAPFEKLGKLNDQIKTGVNRVTEISKSMRNASRADTEKTNDVNLVEIIEESLIITGNKVKQFQLVNNIPDGIALATCNRSQIGQVVMNFLSNAADALVEYKEQHKDHKGTIQVDLSISNQNQPKTVQLSVSDNGTGVPQENRDKVLNAFFTTKEAGIGTGLGLAICGKIAQGHDGTIHIEDGLENGQGGYGAKFTLEFVG
jgi:signal transduction histidine kinase